MSEFSIPHAEPIKFVKKILSTNTEEASVAVAFNTMPTLGMLVEAAAQSSSGITNDDVNGRVGFVVSLKNIKLLQKPKSTIYQIDIKIDYKVENLKYLSFSIINNESKTVASGSLVIALQ